MYSYPIPPEDMCQIFSALLVAIDEGLADEELYNKYAEYFEDAGL